MGEPSPPCWRPVIDALRDGVALVEPGGALRSWNRAFVALAGIDARTLAARPRLGDVLPWLADVAAATGQTQREVQVGDRWLEVRVDPMDGGDVLVVLADVTSRRRTAERLRESDEVLGALFDASPIAICAVDLDMRVQIWNAAAERLFGWPFAEIPDRSFLAVVPESEEARFRELFAQVVSGNGFTGVEVKRRRRDGAIVHVGVSTAPLRDADGRVVGTMTLFDDLTERRRLEEKVRQVERTEAIGRLAGGVAHDFNNLLTIILSACDLLDAAPEAERARLLGDVRRAAERASELTRHLLAYSRRQVLQPARIDLSESVREAASMIERLIGEDIEVVLELAREMLPVVADRTQLQRVVLNLAINARDAMPQGGRLVLSTRPLAVGRRPATLAPGDYVELAVSDSGRGVEPHILPHIFEPFFTTKGPGEGTGLGLAMVYGVVQQSGGDVLVESGRNGATFRVLLPRAEGDVPLATPDLPERVAGRRPNATVLLVEDDDEVRATLRDLLVALGYRVLAAGGGAEALQVADGHDGPIHVLLTDVVMPGMSGREVAEAIVAWRPTTRVLFMSGYTDDAALRTGFESATTHFLQKPFTASALDARIRKLLAPRRSSG